VITTLVLGAGALLRARQSDQQCYWPSWAWPKDRAIFQTMSEEDIPLDHATG
jgi:hypothetical protein